MHDDVTQRLATVAVELGLLQTRPEDDGGLLHEKLETIRQQVLDLADTVRDVSHRYHPSVLSHSNLESALKMLADDFESVHDAKVRVKNRGADLKRIARPTATAVYRIVQEALGNVTQHSLAKKVLITLDCEEDGDLLRVIVLDDGQGFSSDKPADGLGITSMEERATAIGGNVEIHSEPGEGTRVEISAPMADGCEEED